MEINNIGLIGHDRNLLNFLKYAKKGGHIMELWRTRIINYLAQQPKQAQGL